jgi:glutaredoxin
LRISQDIDAAINDHDVVLFGKVGCGYCLRAKQSLSSSLTNPSTSAFTLQVFNVVDADNITANQSNAIKTVLQAKLALWDMTYPQVVVKGLYVGGADDTIALLDERGEENCSEFDNLLKSERTPLEPSGTHGKVTWYPPLLALASKPDLFAVPSMRNTWYPKVPWYCFQFTMYSNLLRYISVLHIAFMSSIILLANANQHKAAYYVMLIFVIDLAGFVVVGPSPLTITGTVSTYAFWKYRGNATSTLPYKPVFLAYIYTFGKYLLDNSPNSAPTSPNSQSGGAIVGGLLLNSIFLAVFRF